MFTKARTLLQDILGHTQFVLGDKLQSLALVHQLELGTGNVTLWTLGGRILALINIPTYGANPFLCSHNSIFFWLV